MIMNRAERRKQEKMGISKPHIMQTYREEAYNEGYKRGMSDIVDITFYMVAYTLSYKLEKSKEELQELMRAIYNNIDSYRTGHLEPRDYDEIVEQMRTEYEIKLN